MQEHPTQFDFGKSQYHQISAMEQWCRANIGAGGWANPAAPMAPGHLWTVHSMFGNTTFLFKQPSHCTLFTLKWS